MVWAHENSSASGDRRERGGGWYGGERLCRAASLSRTEPRRYSTWNIDGMCQCVLMNRGDTRPPGVPRFFAVRKFDCRDRMGRNGRRKRRREKNSFPIDFYCLVIVRAQSLAASPFSFRFFEFVRDIRQYSKLLFILSSLLLFVDLIIRNFCDSGKRERAGVLDQCWSSVRRSNLSIEFFFFFNRIKEVGKEDIWMIEKSNKMAILMDEF